MKDCKATAMTVDLEEVEQIVEKLERGEEVEPFYLYTFFFWSFLPIVK